MLSRDAMQDYGEFDGLMSLIHVSTGCLNYLKLSGAP